MRKFLKLFIALGMILVFLTVTNTYSAADERQGRKRFKKSQVSKIFKKFKGDDDDDDGQVVVGPPGPQGEQGPEGEPGQDGLNCWDLDADKICDLVTEDKNADGECTALDCQGAEGPRGPPGPPGAGGDTTPPTITHDAPSVVGYPDPVTLNITIVDESELAYYAIQNTPEEASQVKYLWEAGLTSYYFQEQMPITGEVNTLLVAAADTGGNITRTVIEILYECADCDGDGSPAVVDCDDNDPTVYPGAPERCDGLDNDCDGFVPNDELDQDGDGYRICQGDCDDADASINPGGLEEWIHPLVCSDGVDNNCNGLTDLDEPRCIRPAESGDLIITEIMINPGCLTDNEGEWFELYNTAASALNLRDLVIRNQSNQSFLIDSDLILAPGSYLVFASSPNAQVDADYVYNGYYFEISNVGGRIELFSDLFGTIASFAYSSGFDREGYSNELSTNHYDASSAANQYNWCRASSASPYGCGDHGTPGVDNDCSL